jgi:23S rRNA pseudouridine1911/1915/1917 synthase
MVFKNVAIIFEDNHIIVVNKPNGLLSQRDVTGDDSIIEVLKEYIKITYSKPGNVFLGSVHRLDRPASGVMVFAKTSKALSRLTESMRLKLFKKEYLVVIDGKVEEKEGKLTHYLVKDEKLNIVRSYSKNTGDGKLSSLIFKFLANYGNKTLLHIDLLTGRSHQIRSQLSHEFFPVTGDFKYGSGFKGKNHKIYLHCYKMMFPHPVTKSSLEFSFKPDMDDPMWAVFEKFID